MNDHDDPYSGYRPDMDQHREPDPRPLRAGGLVIPLLLFGAGTTLVVLVGLLVFR
jgi:hypothetical protein